MGWWEVIKARLLAQPQAVDEAPDERDMRLPARIRASCRIDDGPPHRIEIRSLSLNGLMFRAPVRVIKGQSVLVRVPLSGDLSKRTSEIVEFRTRAVWGRQASSGDTWDVGVTYAKEADARRDEWLNRVLETYRVNLWDDRRQSLRHRVEVPVIIHGRAELEGMVRNLSGGGLQVTVERHDLQLGEVVNIELCPRDELAVMLRGRVVNDVDKHGQRYVSMQFEEVNDAQRHLLLDVIVQTLKPPEPKLED